LRLRGGYADGLVLAAGLNEVPRLVGLPDNGNWSNIAPKPLSGNGVYQAVELWDTELLPDLLLSRSIQVAV
jgi:hypothetical protein